MLLMVTLILVTAPMTAASDGLTTLQAGANEIRFKHNGRTRRLIITTPASFDSQQLHPVLFCFHGAGGKADGQSKRWSPQAEKRGLIVISAEAVQPLAKWNFKENFHPENYDDVGFITKVIEILIANKIANPAAIYATGHSSGGLFCYRLAKQTSLFAALSPMSCGMAKGAHDPAEGTAPVSIMQIIGDQDKSFNGSTNPKITMYSADERIDVWCKFNQCDLKRVFVKQGDGLVVSTFRNSSGIEVSICKVKGQGHHVRTDLRDAADALAMNFLLKHQRQSKPKTPARAGF